MFMSALIRNIVKKILIVYILTDRVVQKISQTNIKYRCKFPISDLILSLHYRDPWSLQKGVPPVQACDCGGFTDHKGKKTKPPFAGLLDIMSSNNKQLS